MPNAALSLFDPSRHLLIAGPTASGKSSLAMQVAKAQGGLIVNADALQIWSCWRVLTARPSAKDESEVPHALYGHVAPDRSYSVGDWLRDVRDLLGQRLIITGGTGLYLTALSRGLAEIPPVPPAIRQRGDAMLAAPDGLAAMLGALDPPTRNHIDQRNPVRVQRAWEVLQATGTGLIQWQKSTGAPLLPDTECQKFVLTSDRDWLADRIALRFHQMLCEGALDEVRQMRPVWNKNAQWAKAIGAADLMAHLSGETSLELAVKRAIIATRQYAKSQRSWFRNRMRDWTKLHVASNFI